MDATRLREIETNDEATEVVVLWGEEPLHVAHVPAGEAFAVGEATDARGRPATDYLIGRESLGVERLPVVVATDAGVAVVVADGARATIGVAGEALRIEALAPAPWASSGMHAYLLPPRATAEVVHGAFTFIVTRTRQAARIARVPLRPRWEDQVWIGAATLAHLALLAMFHLLPPRASALSAERLDDRLRLIPFEVTPQDVEEPIFEATTPGDAPTGEPGAAHQGEAGEMGKKDVPKTQKRYAVKGPADNADPQLAKNTASDPREREGILGVLNNFSGSWNTPTSPFGRDEALGRDAQAALGALLGDTIGESGGQDGLAMAGTGRGAGGRGLGTVGLDRIGTIGAIGGGGGYGGQVRSLGPKGTKVPPPMLGRADVRGALSKEVIQRVIRRHVAEVRYCYEQGLQSRPDLEGRVAVKFVIAPSGAVHTAVVEQSALGHAGVETCIARAVERWAFPSPEGGGIVIVSYPFTLAQSGS